MIDKVSHKKYVRFAQSVVLAVTILAWPAFHLAQHLATIYAATGDAENLTGVIYHDYNFDGTQTTGAFGVDEPGIAGITVTAYCELDNDADPATPGTDATVVADVTDTTGAYTLVVKENYDCRTEVSGWPSHLKPAPSGAGNGTTTQRITVPDGGAINQPVGFINPAEYFGADPYVVANTPIFGDYTNATYNGTESVVGINWSAGGSSGNGTNANHYDTNQVITNATHAETGATYGAAWDRESQTFFSAAFMKNNAGFGPSGPGAIYATGINPTTGATAAATSSWLDVYTLPGVNTCTDPHTAGNLTGTYFGTVPAFDETTFQAVGDCSLADIEISEDGTTMYVVNMATTGTSAGQILAIDMVSKTLVGGSPWEIPTSQIDCPAPLTDIHPGALSHHNGQLYAGAVCGADSTQNAADLRMYVYEVSSAGVFSEIVNEPLNYARGTTAASAVTADWHAWATASSDVPAMSTGITILDNNLYAQPWLMDIDFNGSSMVLGLRDRMADQAGISVRDAAGLINYFLNAGELLCASNQSGSWVLESNGSCGSNNDTAVFDNGGPGGREFFHDNGIQHYEGANGGVSALPGFDDIVFVASSPNEVFDASLFTYGVYGFQYNNLNDGSPDRAVLVTNQNSDGIYYSDDPRFAKGNGIGDVEALSLLAPIELGSYVWSDADGDGIQDPGESPLAGITVRLYDNTGTLLATTTTSIDGEYYFSSAGPDTIPNNGDDLFAAGDSVVIRVDNAADYSGALNGFLTTIDSQDADDDADSDAVEGDVAGVGNGSFAEISVTTTEAGDTDHTLDFGFSSGSLRLGNQLFYDADNDGLYDAGEPGIENVTVELFSDTDTDGVFEPGGDDGSAIRTTTTDSNGNYWFENISDGTFFAAIPTGATNSNVTISGNTGINLNSYFNSTAGGLSNPGSATQEPTDDNVDNNDDGRDNGNGAIPLNYITMSQPITLSASSEPINETSPGGATGDDETEANAQPGSSTPPDNESNLTVDFGFYSLTDLSLTKRIDGSDVDSTFTDSESINTPPAAGSTSFQYLISITNEDLFNSATGVVVTDYVPEGVTITGVNSVSTGSVVTGLPITGASPFGTTEVVWNVGTIAANTTHTLLLDAALQDANLATFLANSLPGNGLNQGVTEVTAMNELDPDSTVDSLTIADPSTFDASTSEDDEDDAFVFIATSIGDFVWEDTNNDGVQDGGEPGLNGITVNLYIDDDATPGPSITDTLYATTTTANNGTNDGAYIFGNLAAATDYWIEFDHNSAAIATSHIPSPQGATTDPLDATDSDGDETTGWTELLNLTADETRTAVDQGYAPLSAISEYGDTPDSGPGTGTGNYETTAANNGAVHYITTDLTIGSLIDADDGTLQDAAANADDTTGIDDEDGVTTPAELIFTDNTVGHTVSVTVTNNTGSAATLYAWADYDDNGDFDNTTERTSVAVLDGTTNGTVSLVFPSVPDTASETSGGTSFMRLRLSTDVAAANPTGIASDGEVEDYQITILNDTMSPGGIETALELWAKAGSDAYDDVGCTNAASAGASVRCWVDQSGNSYSLTENGSGPVLGPSSDTRFNFNNYLIYTNDDLQNTTDTLLGADSNGSVFVIGYKNTNAGQDAALAIGQGGGGEDPLLGTRGPRVLARDGGNYDFTAPNLVTGKAQLFEYRWTDDTDTILGLDNITQANGAAWVNTAGGTHFSIGGDNGGNKDWDGDIAEVIAYSENYTGTDRARIMSYLALKYGITLDQTTATDYVSSDGTTNYWTAADNTGYDNDIAGIAVDTTTMLSQLISQSVEADYIVRGSAATDITTGESFVWANDNGSTAATSAEVPATTTARLTREWKADHTGDIGSLTLAFDLSQQTALANTADPNDYALLIDSDGDFSDANIHTTGAQFSGNFIQFDNVTIPDGSYFTIALYSPPDDFADAPDSGAGTSAGNYEIIDANGGPKHSYDAALHIGALWDGDSGILQNSSANADDNDNLSDEDGIATPGQLALSDGDTAPVVDVVVTNNTGAAATLYGWIDYDGNGVFDNGSERTSVAVSNGASAATVSLTFPDVPATANTDTGGATFILLRLSTDAAAANPTGGATDGEVESHQVTIAATSGTSTIGSLIFYDRNNNGLFDNDDVGLDGVTVELYVDTNVDGDYDNGVDSVSATTTTTGGGQFSFSGVADGEYIVVVPASEFAAAQELEGFISATGSGIFGSTTSGSHEPPPDPDTDIDNDDNGGTVGSDVATSAITIASGTEPTTDGDSDPNTNLSVDLGFYIPLYYLTLALDDNTMDLGLLSRSTIASQQQQYTLDTSNPAGAIVSLSGESTGLDDGSGNAINTVLDGAVTAGSEEYGLSMSSSMTLLTPFDSGDQSIPTTTTPFVNTSGAPVLGGTVDVTYKASIDSTTVSGQYDQIVIVTVVANP